MNQMDAWWAKSPARGEPQGESLCEHVRKVWRNFLAFRARAPDLDRLVGDPRFWLRAAMAVLLHDLGKCADGFQRMLRGKGHFGERHEVLSVAALVAVCNHSSEDLEWIAAAVLSHHRDLPEIARLYRPEDPLLSLPDGLSAIASELTPSFFDRCAKFVAECVMPLLQDSGLCPVPPPVCESRTGPQSTPVQATRDLLNRVRRLHHSVERMPYNSTTALAGRFMRGLLLMADHSASAGADIRACPQLSCPDHLRAALGLSWEQLFDHQKSAAQMSGSAALIAPTGSGKTEAAFLWAANQIASMSRQAVLFYVLPYQASLNAMRWRLERLFGSGMVGLQHSHALSALYKTFIAEGSEPAEAAERARREVALARLHATPVRLLTPYQLLRAAYQSPGHEAVWTELALSLMIFDELHAYEPRRLGMILATLSHACSDMQARVLVLSATIPAPLLRLLSEAIPGLLPIRCGAQTFARFRRHRLRMLEGDLLAAANVNRVASEVQAGAKVLVIANTVARAQRVWIELRRRIGAPVMLLHGRFHSEDRAKKERMLLDHEAGAPRVLVATQVVEVSLDIDFDVLYTDPAPMEALLQRFGRVNRRRSAPERNVFVATEVGDSSVYLPSAIESARRALQPFDGELLDEASLQQALDDIYAGHFGRAWETAVTRSRDEFQREVLASLRPFESDDRMVRLFGRLFDGLEVLPAQLEKQYEQLERTEPLRAPGLLVPISYRQYQALRKRNLIAWRNGVCVVSCPYDEEYGLRLPWADEGE